MTQDTLLAAGIDTAKDKLDVALHGQASHLRVDNCRSGWRALVGWLTQHGAGRVAIEASGGYERGAVAHLRRAGLVVLVLQPLQVKA